MLDWGLGQVQSVIDGRATVNFEDAGKVTINLTEVELIRIGDTDDEPRRTPI
jgi:hypothetical protein